MRNNQAPDDLCHLCPRMIVLAVPESAIADTMSAPSFLEWTDANELLAQITKTARGMIGADGATVVLRDGDHCYYADENAISPLWKGRRFPMSACISGWVMLNKMAAVIPDIYLDTRIPADAYRPTFVKSLAMVPVRRASPIAAIGNYWADHHEVTGQELGSLLGLADAVADALKDEKLYSDFRARIIPF
jgi:GAF domain-containing protein